MYARHYQKCFFMVTGWWLRPNPSETTATRQFRALLTAMTNKWNDKMIAVLAVRHTDLQVEIAYACTSMLDRRRIMLAMVF